MGHDCKSCGGCAAPKKPEPAKKPAPAKKPVKK